MRPVSGCYCQTVGVTFSRRATGLLLAALAMLLLSAPVAGADVFTVTNTEDPFRGLLLCEPTNCTLRSAVASSNASTTVDDLIVVPAAANQYAVNEGPLEVADQVEIRGAGADRTGLDGDGDSVIFEITSPGVLIDGLAITGGEGGIQNNGELTLRRVSVDHNTRPGAGGGIQSNGPLEIYSSFIGANQGGGGFGGGIQATAAVSILNSTVDGNTSDGAGAVKVNGALTIASSAIVGNTSTSSTAAALQASPLTIRDSVFAANRNSAGILNCQSAPTSLGGNVEDTASCAIGAKDRANADSRLGPLALGGGTTLVHSLLPGSAAIDFASACPALDQRGAPRPRGRACDSGPFEVQPPPPGVDRQLRLLVAGGKLKLNRRGVARVKLTCPANEASPPCSGKVVLLTRGRFRRGARRVQVRLATARFSIGAGKSTSVALKLSTANAELVRRSKAARKVVAVVRAADRAGNTQVIRKRLALVPR